MENALNDLSASHLRALLLSEIRLFIECLDKGTTKELEARKEYLKRVLAQLTEKERAEMAHLVWGKNTQDPVIGQATIDIKAITDMLGGALPSPAAAAQTDPESI